MLTVDFGPLPLNWLCFKKPVKLFLNVTRGRVNFVLLPVCRQSILALVTLSQPSVPFDHSRLKTKPNANANFLNFTKEPKQKLCENTQRPNLLGGTKIEKAAGI